MADPSPLTLPAGFRFGVATSAFQTEGGLTGRASRPTTGSTGSGPGGSSRRAPPCGSGTATRTTSTGPWPPAATPSASRWSGPGASRPRASTTRRPSTATGPSWPPAPSGACAPPSASTTSPTRTGSGRTSGSGLDSPERFAGWVAAAVDRLGGGCRQLAHAERDQRLRRAGLRARRPPARPLPGLRRPRAVAGPPAHRPRAGPRRHPPAPARGGGVHRQPRLVALRARPHAARRAAWPGQRASARADLREWLAGRRQDQHVALGGHGPGRRADPAGHPVDPAPRPGPAPGRRRRLRRAPRAPARPGVGQLLRPGGRRPPAPARVTAPPAAGRGRRSASSGTWPSTPRAWSPTCG